MGKCKRDCSSSSSEPGYKKKEKRRHRKFNVQNECQTSVTSLSSSSDHDRKDICGNGKVCCPKSYKSSSSSSSSTSS